MVFFSIPTVSRMRSKGSRFTLGVWGLRVCSLDVAFMFATVSATVSAAVRNRLVQPSILWDGWDMVWDIVV